MSDFLSMMDRIDAGVKRQIAEIELLREVLAECLDYFEDRADADHNGHNFVPNEEMKLAMRIKEVLP